MTLSILRPDSDALAEFKIDRAFEYPLDSILVIPASDHQLEVLGQALRLVERAPWYPIAVRIRSTGPTVPIEFGEGSPPIARVASAEGSRGDHGHVRMAVRARGAPTRSQFRGFLERRFGRTIGDPVGRAIAGAEVSRCDRRILKECGALDVSQTRRLFSAIGLVGTGWQTGASLESLALQMEITPKTAWTWSRELWGMGWRELCTRCSWEGLVELAVRRAAS